MKQMKIRFLPGTVRMVVIRIPVSVRRYSSISGGGLRVLFRFLSRLLHAAVLYGYRLSYSYLYILQAAVEYGIIFTDNFSSEAREYGYYHIAYV